MSWTNGEMEEIYGKVRVKAATDAIFRKNLLADPNKVIAELAGKEIPAGFKIKVIESDPTYQATFVLPDLISDEVTDEDLESVAGGIALDPNIDRITCPIKQANCWKAWGRSH